MSFPSCLLLKTHRADFQGFCCLLNHHPQCMLTLVISRLEVKPSGPPGSPLHEPSPSRSPGSPLHEPSWTSSHLRQWDTVESLSPKNKRKVSSDKTVLSAVAKLTSPLRSGEIMALFSRQHLGLCIQGRVSIIGWPHSH